MKLPRLSNPTTTVIEESSFLGESSRTEITQASMFDLMSANQQWAVVAFMVTPIFVLIAIILFSQTGGWE